MITVKMRELFWGHMQYSINGPLGEDKCALIRRSFTKLITPYQRSWFTSPACIFPYIYLPLHISLLFSLRNCLMFVLLLFFNIKLKHVFSLFSWKVYRVYNYHA